MFFARMDLRIILYTKIFKSEHGISHSQKISKEVAVPSSVIFSHQSSFQEL